MTKPKAWVDAFPAIDLTPDGCFIQRDPVERRDVRWVPRTLIRNFDTVTVGTWLTLCQPIDPPDDQPGQPEPGTSPAAIPAAIGGTS